MSTLKVNTIEDLSGIPNKGKIIQVVQSTKTDTASITGFTFGDVGLSASITPSATNHKILIMIQANIGGSIGYDMKAGLFTKITVVVDQDKHFMLVIWPTPDRKHLLFVLETLELQITMLRKT